MGAARVTIECRHIPMKMVFETSESFDLVFDSFDIFDTGLGKREIPKMRPRVSMEFEIDQGSVMPAEKIVKKKPKKGKKKN
jgi:hypothetical protein